MPPERIIWQKTPIELALSVGKEQRVDFPGPVRIGLPATLQPILRVQSVAGNLYLLAHRPFEPTRVMVRAIESGAVYLLDLSADNKSAPTAAIQIFDPEVEQSDLSSDQTEPSPIFPTYGYVALTRFAAQKLYAPARLLRDLPGVVRVPVRRKSVQLIHAGQVTAEPLVAWRAGDLYLTAVKLRNSTSHPVTLDPRTLRGTWLTATFQHNRLHVAGNEADTTVVYLISARPFETSL
ncbi:MAG: TIGR03749 family integrating conjugative element protein [Chromatiaceae bacterium]|nr:TIGR03749 family integrating conjugative element protein [Chromatiaceae bacterium]